MGNGKNIHIDLGYEQLQLTPIRQVNPSTRNQLAETAHESVGSTLETLRVPIFDHKINIFLLVLFRHRDVSATWLKFRSDHIAEALLPRCEMFIDHVGDFVVSACIVVHEFYL